MTKKMLALAAAGVMAIGLAACGGDDDGDDTGSETTATAISEADFVEQGNAICAAGNDELGTGPEDGDLEGFVTDTFIPNIQGQIDAIRALGAPEGMEDQVAQFLDDAEGDLAELSEDPSGLSEDTFAETNDQARELGLDECAG